jgi:ornithine cyclodeaminase/alanine dehydrogenase-like protein (mu-crystallin family)
MQVIDSDVLLPSLDPLALVEALRRGHREGIDAVDRVLLSEHGLEGTNHMLIWPAWRFGAALGSKLVTVFPNNEASGSGPNIRSVYLLFDGKDGRPLCAITGESFTRYKTAADSALAATFLGRAEAEVLTVIGAGAQAETHIRVLCAARPSISRINIWNRTFSKAGNVADALARSAPKAIPRDDLEAAVREADIVSTLTSSAHPILRGAWLKQGAHVDLVGSFTPEMREADDEAIARGRLFIDSRFFTLAACGDIADPLARGILRETDIVGDLFDLCSEIVPGRLADEETTIFKNGGGGHLDLMVARALLEWHTSPRSSGCRW